MDNFNNLLEELQLQYKTIKKDRIFDRQQGYVNDLPIHMNLFLDGYNKDNNKYSTIITLDKRFIEQLFLNKDFRKIEMILFRNILNNGILEDFPKFVKFEDDDKGYIISKLHKIYKEFLKPIIDKHYPPVEKEFKETPSKINIDMRMKEAKFDIVYDNVYGEFDLGHLKNRYKHRNDLKKKFLYGETQVGGEGKIDYQLALFNRCFELEMLNIYDSN